MRLSSLLVALVALLGVSALSSSAWACGSNEENVCNWVTQNVCDTQPVQKCENVNVCTDPMDASTCHYEYQCQTAFEYQCHDVNVMQCECIARPGDFEHGPRCISNQCTSCSSGQRYCGSWDSCSSTWRGGTYEGCR